MKNPNRHYRNRTTSAPCFSAFSVQLRWIRDRLERCFTRSKSPFKLVDRVLLARHSEKLRGAGPFEDHVSNRIRCRTAFGDEVASEHGPRSPVAGKAADGYGFCSDYRIACGANDAVDLVLQWRTEVVDGLMNVLHPGTLKLSGCNGTFSVGSQTYQNLDTLGSEELEMYRGVRRHVKIPPLISFETPPSQAAGACFAVWKSVDPNTQQRDRSAARGQLDSASGKVRPTIAAILTA
jgi:hypothetical protein